MTQTKRALAAADAKIGARAILILLVIAGHNRILHDHYYYSAYIFLYAFHVGGFFLLTTLSPPRAINLHTLRSLFRRVLLPFLFFSLAYAIAAKLAGIIEPGDGWHGWSETYLRAVLLANAASLDGASGLKMLWFLPAFFLFCLSYNVIGALRGTMLATALVVAGFVHIVIGELPQHVAENIPWSANVVAFLILPALLFSLVASAAERRPVVERTCLAVFLASSALAIHNGYELILSDSVLPSWTRPAALITGDLQLICGTITALAVGRRIVRLRAARFVGANSIKLYLLHPCINMGAYLLLEPRLPWFTAMIVITLIAVAATCLLSIIVNSISLGRRAFGEEPIELPRQRGPQTSPSSLEPTAPTRFS